MVPNDGLYQNVPLNDRKTTRVDITKERVAEIKSNTDHRWKPDVESESDYVQLLTGPREIIYSAQSNEDAVQKFSQVIDAHFKDNKGGMVSFGGASGAGKGTLLDGMADFLPDRHIITLEQDWFQHSPSVREKAHLKRLDVMSNDDKRKPAEWTDVWNHTRQYNYMVKIRDAIDSGVHKNILIEQAWHRAPNVNGEHFYNEVIEIGPETIVMVDQVYDVSKLPRGGRFDDLSVRLDVPPKVVAERFADRTQMRYGKDKSVYDQKMRVNKEIIVPSYKRYLELQQGNNPPDLAIDLKAN